MPSRSDNRDAFDAAVTSFATRKEGREAALLPLLGLHSVRLRKRAERALCAQCAVLNTNAIHCQLNNTDTARCALMLSRGAAGVGPAGCTAPLLAALPANMLLALRSQAHALGHGAVARRRPPFRV